MNKFLIRSIRIVTIMSIFLNGFLLVQGQQKNVGKSISVKKKSSSSAQAENTIQFKVWVHAFDKSEEKISIEFLEYSQVYPGTFIQPGTMGALKISGAKYSAQDLKKGSTVMVTQVYKEDGWFITSVKRVSKSK